MFFQSRNAAPWRTKQWKDVTLSDCNEDTQQTSSDTTHWTFWASFIAIPFFFPLEAYELLAASQIWFSIDATELLPSSVVTTKSYSLWKTSQNSHHFSLLCKFSVTTNPGHLLQILPLACNFFYQMLNTVTYETVYINTNSSVTAIFLFTNDLAFS